MGTLFVDNIKQQSSQGSGTITIGASGEKIDLGATAGGTFTARPAFEAYQSTTTTYTDSTNFKVEFDTETLDTDNAYDNATNYRFTPQVAGKYYISANVAFSGTASNNLEYCQLSLYKNGTQIKYSYFDGNNTNSPNNVSVPVFGILDANGSTDYFEAFGYGVVDGGTIRVTAGFKSSYFLGYRLIGV